ncbi:GAD-like domain-containing protein [Vibrio harveyi]|uniref:GAD-like domain-containing protein n=1 Tax=Vibrio harveyi TaxID=669 RepID=UPI00215BD3E7|nr:GAD-like domain-containing protein [Vibrio harveyi]MCR9771583.1 aspartyl-tRNA amidotransferase [Vibrio harveyi]
MFRWIAAHYVELNKLNDEYFEMFIEEFGEPTEHILATDQQVEAYRGILPDQLLKYWQMVGFSGFNDGLFWITNPAEFEDVLESFLDDTEFAHYDNYHVIARSAYGQLYLWGERTGASLDIATHLNWIMTNQGHAKDISKGDANIAIQSFFGFQDKEYIDVEVSSKPLFPSAIKKHGPVGKEEVMVFTPYLFKGGKKSADAMTKEDLHVFLQVMADLGGAEIIDMASMVGNVLKSHRD